MSVDYESNFSAGVPRDILPVPPTDPAGNDEPRVDLAPLLRRKQELKISTENHATRLIGDLELTHQKPDLSAETQVITYDQLHADYQTLLADPGSIIEGDTYARLHTRLKLYGQKLEKEEQEEKEKERLETLEKRLEELYDRRGRLSWRGPEKVGAATQKIDRPLVEQDITTLEAKRREAFNRPYERREEQRSVRNMEENVPWFDIEQTLKQITQNQADVGEAFTGDPAVNVQLFDRLYQTTIAPRLVAHAAVGNITRQQAEEVARRIVDAYQPITTSGAEPRGAPAFKEIAAIAPAVSDLEDTLTALAEKRHRFIFEALLRNESVPVIRELVTRAETINPRYDLQSIIESRYQDIYPRTTLSRILSLLGTVRVYPFQQPEWNLWGALAHGPGTELFDPGEWERISSEAQRQIYSDVREYQTSPYFSRVAVEALWGVSKNHPERRAYFPVIIRSLLCSPHTFTDIDQSSRALLYEVLTSLTPEEVTHLSQEGYPAVAPLQTLFRQHPQVLHRGRGGVDHDIPAKKQFYRAVAEFSFQSFVHPESTDKDKSAAFYNLDYAWREMFDWTKPQAVLFSDEFNPEDPIMAKWILLVTRYNDKILTQTQRHEVIPDEATIQQFQQASVKLRHAYGDESGAVHKRAFIKNPAVLALLARQPEKADEMLGIIFHDANFDELSLLMAPGGPLTLGQDAVMEEVFSAENASEKIREIIESFRHKKPIWDMLFDTSRRAYGEQLRKSDSIYPIDTVPSHDGAITVSELFRRHRQAARQNHHPTELETMIGDKEYLKVLERDAPDAIPFARFNPVTKERIFHQYLTTLIQRSRDEDIKRRADERNRTLAFPRIGTGAWNVHGSAIDYLDSILLNGNLSGEVLPRGVDQKNFPFHAEFIRFERTESDAPIPEMIARHERLAVYGGSSRHGGGMGDQGQIFYLYDRAHAEYEKDKDCEPPEGGWPGHRIVLGGVPSTEVTGIILRYPDATLRRAMTAIVENGFYIPLYDFNGNLLFTPEQYDQHRKDWNLDVTVPLWDFAFKVADEKGSHKPAGEYIIPTESGTSQRYYVKFAQPSVSTPDSQSAEEMELEDKSGIWNEYLADSIYRHLGIPVANTAIIRTNRVYGHASQAQTYNPFIVDGRMYGRAAEMLPHDHAPFETIDTQVKNGFLIDALIANWDMIKAKDLTAAMSGNVLMSGGKAVRIDNGGALLFRARGVRKTPEDFGENVKELETMRDGYPGLTEDDIANQVVLLKDRLKDHDVDTLVDSVRLHEKDRTALKYLLKKRRDYILDYFKDLQPAA